MTVSRLTKERLIAAGAPEADAARASDHDWREREIGHLLVRVETAEHLVLAYDAGVPLVVDAGRVTALEDPPRLVNSSVCAFIDVLCRYQQYVEEVLSVASEPGGERTAQLAARDMERLDPRAFEQDFNYWPVVCAQMIEGNL